MRKENSDWVFFKKASRPALSEKQMHYWKASFLSLLKAGIEVELNLPDKNGACDRQNYMCQCQAHFKAPNPMEKTSMCFEQCQKWDEGKCVIAQAEGCVGINCAKFEPPCSKCDKYDRGCSSCPELYDINKDPRKIREIIGKRLQPTKFVGSHGATGTYKVCKDGSLAGDGGVEVATVGRRVQFDSFYDMIKNIIDISAKHGAYTNERCSIHIHVLTSYLTPAFGKGDVGDDYLIGEITELERPVPEIIVANFHQLVRRYQCALIWLSAAGTSPDKLTRWEKFRKSVLPYSAVKYKMPVVVSDVGQASGSKAKYAMMNYEQMGFNAIGEAERFHIEGRYMDGCLSPAAITAHTCLLIGLVIKAVELSRWGILQSGDRQYMQLQNEIYKNLCNGDGDWSGGRFSNTKGLAPYVSDLQKQSHQLIRLIKNTLSGLAPADEILRSLADRPLAVRLCDGETWEQIEADLMPFREDKDEVEEALIRVISLGSISDCDTEEEWVDAVSLQIADELGVGSSKEKTDDLKGNVVDYVTQLSMKQKIHWSRDVGTYLAG